jgi:ATP-dependent HslUV protease ATP-binding subunit HslU
MDNIYNDELNDLTPIQTVAELDLYIIGQHQAKKAVAIALRNRIRRMKVEGPLKDEIVPKNILMIGPTGVGKTEIARRLAKLVDAPFIKVEVTKFTEIGYVGRDVDSIIRDLMEISMNMTRTKLRKKVKDKAIINAQERILEALVGTDASPETKEKFRAMLLNEELNDKEIELKVPEASPPSMPAFDIPGMPGSQMSIVNIKDMIGDVLGVHDRKKLKKMTVKEGYAILMAEEGDKLLDEEKIIKKAINAVQTNGIVVLDEIDKVTSRNDKRGGEVSREGVQRDLLPIVEGSTVSTKYGAIDTSHILFIASGAFHISKPSDLLPELQGRFPIRVELQPLTKEDMALILEEPKSSLIKQYIALMKADGVELEFTSDAIKRIAEIAAEVNSQVENIGARRLHTVMEKLLEELSYGACEKPKGFKITIDEAYVNQQLEDFTKKIDLSKFIL